MARVVNRELIHIQIHLLVKQMMNQSSLVQTRLTESVIVVIHLMSELHNKLVTFSFLHVEYYLYLTKGFIHGIESEPESFIIFYSHPTISIESRIVLMLTCLKKVTHCLD